MSLTNFDNVSFPMPLAMGASGGPERRTEVVELASGREARNGIWAGSRRRWDVGGAIARMQDVYELTRFFEARQGRLRGFLFRDFTDDRSGAPGQIVSASDQLIGTGDGNTASFQIVKRYGETARRILKPVPGSVLIAVDGVLESGFTLDEMGVVTLSAAPANGAEVTAGYRFDCAARFDTDRLEVSLEAFGAGRVAHVPLVELVG